MNGQKAAQGLRIDWQVRFRNRVWLAAFASAVTGFVYKVLSLLDIMPAVNEDALIRAVEAMLYVLTMLGVVMDPTTGGVGDPADETAEQAEKTAGGKE